MNAGNDRQDPGPHYSTHPHDRALLARAMDQAGWSGGIRDVRGVVRPCADKDARPMHIEFTGFAGDCLISGRLLLGARRLTDQLNAESAITLQDVVLEGLDGQRVTTPTFTIDRSELCAVVARGPRGLRVLRIPTDKRRLHAQIGPYVVLGRYHGPHGATNLRSFTERDPMVPLTDATIAYVVGGILEVIDVSTLIVNRELTVWYRETDDAIDRIAEMRARPTVAGRPKA